MDSKQLLVYLSIKYKGDFNKILKAIKNREKINEEELNKAIKDIKSKYITILDEEYPESLKKVSCPPIVLFYYGDISLISNINNIIASVGSRNASEYGISKTREIIRDLSSNYIIASGLAKGIDAVSHKSAIDFNKKTIAVLGCGIDYIYPKENKDLYEVIKKDHLLLSEYPLDTKPSPEYFPFRNRIIAGLSRAIFVGESYINSGTNVTVFYGLQQGKDIFALPYAAGLNSYNNKLILDGATLVETSSDIEDNLSKI